MNFLKQLFVHEVKFVNFFLGHRRQLLVVNQLHLFISELDFVHRIGFARSDHNSICLLVQDVAQLLLLTLDQLVLQVEARLDPEDDVRGEREDQALVDCGAQDLKQECFVLEDPHSRIPIKQRQSEERRDHNEHTGEDVCDEEANVGAECRREVRARKQLRTVFSGDQVRLVLQQDQARASDDEEGGSKSDNKPLVPFRHDPEDKHYQKLSKVEQQFVIRQVVAINPLVHVDGDLDTKDNEAYDAVVDDVLPHMLLEARLDLRLVDTQRPSTNHLFFNYRILN